MKKIIALILLASSLLAFFMCSQSMPSQKKIVALFRANEEIFLGAVESGDYSAVEALPGVQEVYVGERYVKILCDGAGMGSSTHYYGIFYHPDVALFSSENTGVVTWFVQDGNGYLYQEEGGDNRFYVEPLGSGFYYYEAHY